jgi:very-short-patch-repair endonuclease
MRIRSRFAQKICDYVLLDRGLPVAVIELDDSTHDSKRDKDSARDALLAGAGIPTVRFDSRAKPSAHGIRRAARQARRRLWF